MWGNSVEYLDWQLQRNINAVIVLHVFSDVRRTVNKVEFDQDCFYKAHEAEVFQLFFLILMKVLFNTLTFKRLNLTNESLCHISDWINCVSNVVQHHWQVQGSGQEIIRGNLPSNIFISPRINAENSERWLIMILRLIVQIPSHSSKSPNR